MAFDRAPRGRVAPIGQESGPKAASPTRSPALAASLRTLVGIAASLRTVVGIAAASLRTLVGIAAAPLLLTLAGIASVPVLTLGGIASLAIACGPSVKPPSPPAEPEGIARDKKPAKASYGGRQVLVGEMCPQGAGGRPAIAPLMMRGVDWNDTAAEVTATVERGSVPRFFVFGVDGKTAGTFDTLGIVEVGIAQPVATGTYVGASPCTYGGAKATDTRAEDPKCGVATKGCGIAVGEITSPDDPAKSASIETGGACMSGTDLMVDIDGDGRLESFPIAAALDGIRAPAQEWSASPTAAPTAAADCKPKFQIYDLKLVPEARPKQPPEKATVVVDLLGVADLDGDGRKELILAMRFPTVRSIVVYTASESSQRLVLAGEATGFK